MIRTEDLSDETLDAILEAEASDESKALNVLMDDS